MIWQTKCGLALFVRKAYIAKMIEYPFTVTGLLDFACKGLIVSGNEANTIQF